MHTYKKILEIIILHICDINKFLRHMKVALKINMIKYLLIIILVWSSLFAPFSNVKNRNEENNSYIPSPENDKKKVETKTLGIYRKSANYNKTY